MRVNTTYCVTHLYANGIYAYAKCHALILVSWIETFIFMKGVIIQMKPMKWCLLFSYQSHRFLHKQKGNFFTLPQDLCRESSFSNSNCWQRISTAENGNFTHKVSQFWCKINKNYWQVHISTYSLEMGLYDKGISQLQGDKRICIRRSYFFFREWNTKIGIFSQTLSIVFQCVLVCVTECKILQMRCYTKAIHLTRENKSK